MRVKLFEVRDRNTFLPVLAVALDHNDEQESYLLRRAGYGLRGGPYVVLSRLIGGPSNYDPYEWRDRTMSVAHRHILERFDELEPGAVVDVEFLLGERSSPKTSERVEAALW